MPVVPPGPPDTPSTPAAPPAPDAGSAPNNPSAPAAPAVPQLNDLQRKLGATVLAEAEPEGTQDEKIAWVYFTFVETRGQKEQGLNASNQFKLMQLWFRVWMTALGDTQFAKDKEPIPQWSKEAVPLELYVGSRYFKQANQPRADKMVETVRAMYASPEKNPYKDATNQGSAGYGKGSDFNRSDVPWQPARLFYWLSKCGELIDPPSGLTVEILPAKNPRFQTVLFNESVITSYFKKHPDQRRKEVQLYTAETDRKPPCRPKAAPSKEKAKAE